MKQHVFRVLFPFGGLGLGALGFKEAGARVRGIAARFEVIGGIDSDDEASQDFVTLTGAPSLTADIGALTSDQLRAFAGDQVPDGVFFSPPCKGASGLLSNKNAKTKKYQRMNGLALTWLRLMFATWKERPALVLLENVPRLKTRAPTMIRKLIAMLRKEGYVVNDGFHDCGSLGGLAQHRRRYLLVARLPSKCPPLLYHPKPQRVRGCGEVIGQLPMPEDPAGGPLHRLPRLSWMNWVRLAIIPAGGDWRDFNGVLDWFRGTMGVKGWDEPSGVVTGNARPSTGPFSVADPRLKEMHGRGAILESGVEDGLLLDVDGSEAQEERLRRCRSEIAGEEGRSGGACASTGVATDPRSNPARSLRSSRVRQPDLRSARPSAPGHARGQQQRDEGTGTGRDGVEKAKHPSQRSNRQGHLPFEGTWRRPREEVRPLEATGLQHPQGKESPARDGSNVDPRVSRAFDHGYGVLDWKDPSSTVAGGSYPGQGAYSVADPRVDEAAAALTCEPRAGAYGVISWEDALGAITGHAKIDNGRFAVADPRKPPTFIPAIIAKDGTWHRPFTTLELAALQDAPTTVNGKPLKLAGNSIARWRERIGNGVPRGAARAIAEQMLIALLQAAAGIFQLSNGTVWVAPKKSKKRARKPQVAGVFYGAHIGSEARP